MKFKTKVLLWTFLLNITFVSTSDNAVASSDVLVSITKVLVTSQSIDIEYITPFGCIQGKPSIVLLDSANRAISDGFPPVTKDQEIRILLTVPTDIKCSNPSSQTKASVSFPNRFELRNLIPISQGENLDQRYNKSIFKEYFNSEIRFVGVTQSGTRVPGANPQSNLRNEFLLEEFTLIPNEKVQRRVLGDKFINAILGVTDEGLIVKTFTNNNQSPVELWLVTTDKWRLISNKVIYIEPGVLSRDKKWLIGRQVSDSFSRRVFSQNLETGSITTIFDASSKGGGFICGAYADKANKFAYFTQVTQETSHVYRINLSSRKVIAQGRTEKGFCISGVMNDGRLVGFIGPRGGEAKRVLLIDPNKTKKTVDLALKLESGDDVKFLTGNEGSSHILTYGSLVLLKNANISYLYLSSEERDYWQGPVLVDDFIQYFNPLPKSWIGTSKRAPQP